MSRETIAPPIISTGKALRLTSFSGAVAVVCTWAGYPVIAYLFGTIAVGVVALYLGARTPLVSKCVAYLAAVYAELQSCKWPEIPDVYKAVVFVLWSIAGLAAYLFVVDLVAIDVLERTGVVAAAKVDSDTSSTDQ